MRAIDQPDLKYAEVKGWLKFPQPRKERISRDVRSQAEYWNEYRRKHPEKVRTWNRNHYRRRRAGVPRINQITGIPVSPSKDRRTYQRLYMRLQRTGTTVNFYRKPILETTKD
jgi:hypothetical protein